MKYHIIFNPTAKSGKAKPVLDKVCKRLTQAGKEFEIHETITKGHAKGLAETLSKTVEELIIIGGDGTVHEVLNGITDPQKVRIAIIPAGTGNDFCSGVGISFDPDSAMAAVLRGDAKPTDYIDFSGRRCLNVGGMGMDVAVLERVSRGNMKGKIKYLWSLISTMFTFKGQQVRLSVNGKVYTEKALFVAVCNGSQFGGGIRICPGAEVADGKLEVVLVRQLGFFGIIRAFISLMRGKILSFPETQHFYCEAAEILPDSASTIQLDGELYENCRVLDAKIMHGLKIYR
ncbi:MAG: diacylglycerol kinase family lipid kinase [Clostridia bacterium]|nr:diacylglycerol kinase family lipid kinase [Clostridia bacterium]